MAHYLLPSNKRFLNLLHHLERRVDGRVENVSSQPTLQRRHSPSMALCMSLILDSRSRRCTILAFAWSRSWSHPSRKLQLNKELVVLDVRDLESASGCTRKLRSKKS